MPWLVWLNGMGVVLQSERSRVRFPFRAHAWVAGQVPGWGCVGGNRSDVSLAHPCFSPSLSPSPHLSKNKLKPFLKILGYFFNMTVLSLSSELTGYRGWWSFGCNGWLDDGGIGYFKAKGKWAPSLHRSAGALAVRHQVLCWEEHFLIQLRKWEQALSNSEFCLSCNTVGNVQASSLLSWVTFKTRTSSGPCGSVG